VIGDRREVERAPFGKLDDAGRSELAAIWWQTVGVLGDPIYRGLRVIGWRYRITRIDKGRQPYLLAPRETIGVAGRIACIEGRCIRRVFGVQMEFAEERLPARLGVWAICDNQTWE